MYNRGLAARPTCSRRPCTWPSSAQCQGTEQYVAMPSKNWPFLPHRWKLPRKRPNLHASPSGGLAGLDGSLSEGLTPLASRSTNSPNKRPMAIVKCKMHKTTQARGNFKIPCILQPAACKEGVPRRKAV